MSEDGQRLRLEYSVRYIGGPRTHQRLLRDIDGLLQVGRGGHGEVGHLDRMGSVGKVSEEIMKYWSDGKNKTN